MAVRRPTMAVRARTAPNQVSQRKTARRASLDKDLTAGGLDTSYEAYLQWVQQQQQQQQHQGMQQQQQWAGLAGGIASSAQPTQLTTQQHQQTTTPVSGQGGQQGDNNSSNSSSTYSTKVCSISNSGLGWQGGLPLLPSLLNSQHNYTSRPPPLSVGRVGSRVVSILTTRPFFGSKSKQNQQQHTVQAGLASAGLSLGAIGIQQGGPGGLFSDGKPGMWSGGDLLSGLQSLHDASKRKRSQSWMRPDYHLPVDKGYDEMTYRELVYGMVNVAQYINKAGIPHITVGDYLEHMKYICLKEIKPTFAPKAVANYEYEVTSKVLCGKIPAYMAGEHDAYVNNLGMENTLAFIRVQQQLSKQVQSMNDSQGRQGQGRQRQNIQGYIPCPDHICKKWNFSICDFHGCVKAHRCAVCEGSHRAKGGCPSGQGQYSQQGRTQGHSQYQQQQQYQQQGYYPQQNQRQS